MVINNAIERGVPMFNNNNSEGCAAVYAAAARRHRFVDGFGLSSPTEANWPSSFNRSPACVIARTGLGHRRIMDSMLSGRMQM